MLNKRFKIANCKTSLKLATSRLKLMKNKKVVQINQMKKELAQLLESGQDRTARIRVEHVIREEKMIAAYDLIEIYCELIVARLPIIESQKTCPIDLKEAITSVIFAAPRCSDIPELADARKNFTVKYGKEFVSAALELRPDSGVSRMVVEKLSAVAPDLQTKLKVLSSVAKEHNISWDPTLLQETESKASDDLLNGPVNFEKGSVMNVDTHKIQTSNVQNVHSHEEKLNAPDDFSHQNRRYTLNTQNITSSTDTNPSGMDSEMMNMNRRHSFHSNSNNSSSGKEKNWTMEFKDATSAAQAAAESAERASMAARAAAQLSNQGKISRQHSTQSHESPKASSTSQIHSQHHFKDSYHNSNKRNPKIQNPQTDPNEHDTSPKATIRKQPSITSSGSHSSTMSHEHNVVGQRTFVDQRSYETDSEDDEKDKFDAGFEYNEVEAKSFFPSPDREEIIRPIENTRVSSPRNKQDTQKVKNHTKTRIELNDLVERDSTNARLKKYDREPQIVEKNSEFLNQSNDLDTGNKELKFGTLTGGIRNKGSVKHTKTGITDSSPLVDRTSKPSSFNSKASRIEKKEASVSMSSSESESDDQSDKYSKNRSQFAPPDVFFNEGGITDSKTGSTGLSRRTKGQVEPEGKTVISKTSMHRSTMESSSPIKEVSEQPLNPRKKIVESGKSNLSSQTSSEANDVKKPSHVHPKLPEYDSLAARIQSLQAKHR